MIQTIKTKSYKIFKEVPKSNFVSVTDIVNYFKGETDFIKIAEMCSKNTNHEMFGISVENIIDEWKQRGDVGKVRGKILDSYIANKLHNIPFTLPSDATPLDYGCKIMQDKIESFNMLYDDVILANDMKPLSNELRINYKIGNYGISARLDELFTVGNKLVLVDYKNTEKIRVKGFEKYKQPLDIIYKCEYNEYFLQLYIYKFILKFGYGVHIDACRVFQIMANGYEILKPKQFIYDDYMIGNCINVAFNEIINNRKNEK